MYLMKKMFIGLSAGLVNRSNHTKCTLLCNQKCMIDLRLLILHSNEDNQEFHFYPFAVKLDRYVGRCSALNDLSNKVCLPNKTEDLNLTMLNMITETKKSKNLTKNISS